MLNFSKSKYCAFCKCNMKAWLNRYKPGEAVFSDSTLARMSVGNEVGDLAMQYFGDFVEVTEYCRRPKWKNGNLVIAKQLYFGIVINSGSGQNRLLLYFFLSNFQNILLF